MEATKKRQLTDKIAQIKQQLAAKIQELEKEAEQKIISSLESNAEDEIRELIGEPFRFDGGT